MGCGTGGTAEPGEPCVSDGDCAGDARCGVGIDHDGEATPRVCMEHCPEGVSLSGRCPGGQRCVAARDASSATIDDPGICFEGGSTPLGSACFYELECAAGLACAPTSSGALVCRPTCDTSADCQGSQICQLGRCEDPMP